MLKELKEWHQEELNDSKKYMEMAEKAPDEYKGIFKDIAKEENTHANLLEAIIKDWSGHCPEEEEKPAVNTEAVKSLFKIPE